MSPSDYPVKVSSCRTIAQTSDVIYLFKGYPHSCCLYMIDEHILLSVQDQAVGFHNSSAAVGDLPTRLSSLGARGRRSSLDCVRPHSISSPIQPGMHHLHTHVTTHDGCHGSLSFYEA